MEVVSLYDFTGGALEPWAAAGYTCTAYDLAHPGDEVRDGVRYRHADLHDMATLRAIVRRHRGKVAFLSAFPVCTDLASSGAAWWAEKARRPVSCRAGLPEAVASPTLRDSNLARRRRLTVHDAPPSPPNALDPNSLETPQRRTKREEASIPSA